MFTPLGVPPQLSCVKVADRSPALSKAIAGWAAQIRLGELAVTASREGARWVRLR
jgi:hypothetical protein